ncbi:MAG: hypothetical protein ACPGRD_06635 [Planktomarina sp.]
MKIFFWILGILTLCILLAVRVLFWLVSGAVLPTMTPAKMKPPPGFIAADFPKVTALADTDDLRVFDLTKLGEYFEHGYVPEERVTHVSVFPKDGGRTRVFFDQRGNQLGQISDTVPPFPMGRSFVGIDGYYLVSANNLSAKQEYVDLGQIATKAEMSALIDASDLYRSFSNSELPKTVAERGLGLSIHVFRKDGVWMRATTDFSDYIGWKTAPFDELTSQYWPHRMDQNITPAPVDHGLRLTFFDQQEYFRRKSAPMGSTTGVGRPEHWRGTGYYQLNIGDTAVSFRVENDVMNLSGSGSIHLIAHGHADIQMVLLTYSPRGGTRHSYVISRK